MSNSSLVNIKVPASTSNYTVGRSGRKIEMITIHHMAGILTAEQCGNIFQRDGRCASAHYGVGNDGGIGQYVDEANTAWANANWDANCRAVTIETSNCVNGGNWDVSDIVLNKLIQLVADVAKRNGLGTLVKGQNLTWHSMYSNTNCPGSYLLSKMDYIVAEANKINSQGGNTNTNNNAKSNDEIANEVIAGKWGNGEDRKNRLKNAGYDSNVIQNLVNQKLGVSTKSNLKSVDEIANEVIQGKWGNGQDRKTKLANAGYNVQAVQNRVNELLK